MNYCHKERPLDQLSTLQPFTSHCAPVSLCPFISFFPFYLSRGLMFWTALSFLEAKPGWVAVRGWGKHDCLSPSRVVQLLSAMWHPRGCLLSLCRNTPSRLQSPSSCHFLKNNQVHDESNEQ